MTAASASSSPSTTSTRRVAPALVIAGLVSGLVASVVTVLMALGADGLGVPMEAAPQSAPGPEPIPLGAYPQLTFMSTAIGVVLALALARWARRPARTFVVATVALTVASFALSLTAGHATAATKLVLVLTHVVAAAIIIPALARCLPAGAAPVRTPGSGGAS